MSKSNGKHLDGAVAYNRGRQYPKELWSQVQGRLGLPTDGIPGADTATAIATFQAARGLSADGKLGPGTLAALELAMPSFDRLCTFEGEDVLFFHGKLAVDADGAPNAYHGDDIGIDSLGNAGKPGSWWALVCDDNGHPCSQTASDPFPGYYISTTALCDMRYSERDPRRYVDATKIPYIVLPKNLKELHPSGAKVKKGDLAAVTLAKNPEKVVFAIYADVGPAWGPNHEPGEGSIALAQALGHDPYVNGRVKRGMAGGVFYVVFPGSGSGKPLTAAEIAGRGKEVFATWGGRDKLAKAIKHAPGVG